MQNNVVLNNEEALRNASLGTNLNTGVTTGLTKEIAEHLPQGHHHHHLGTPVEGVPLVGGTTISGTGLPLGTGTQFVSGTGLPLTTGTQYTTGTEYITTTQYVTDPQLLAGQQFVQTGVPLTTNTGFIGTPLTTPLTTTAPLTTTTLPTAGILGTGVVGAGALAGQHLHRNQPVGTVGTVGTTGLVDAGNGTFVFRPIEGKFVSDKDPIGKMDPYCKFKIGFHSGKSAVAKSQGTHPIWNDTITLNRKHHEQFAKLKIKDKDRLTLNDKIGEVKIPLDEIALKGRVQQWFNVYKKDQLAGEILLDVEFQPRNVF